MIVAPGSATIVVPGSTMIVAPGSAIIAGPVPASSCLSDDPVCVEQNSDTESFLTAECETPEAKT